MKTKHGYTLIELLLATAVIAIASFGLIGWVLNVIKIIDTCCAVIDGMLVIRIIGIFIAPLGCVMGYIG